MCCLRKTSLRLIEDTLRGTNFQLLVSLFKKPSFSSSVWSVKHTEVSIGKHVSCFHSPSSSLFSPLLTGVHFQGDDDKFLQEQLLPHKFEEACRNANVPLLLRLQPGYDHSFYFIATFIDDHIRHHAQALRLN